MLVVQEHLTTRLTLKEIPLKGIPYDKYTFRATYEADIFGEPVWITAVHSYTGDFSDSEFKEPWIEFLQEKLQTFQLLGGVMTTRLVKSLHL